MKVYIEGERGEKGGGERGAERASHIFFLHANLIVFEFNESEWMSETCDSNRTSLSHIRWRHQTCQRSKCSHLVFWWSMCTGMFHPLFPPSIVFSLSSFTVPPPLLFLSFNFLIRAMWKHSYPRRDYRKIYFQSYPAHEIYKTKRKLRARKGRGKEEGSWTTWKSKVIILWL